MSLLGLIILLTWSTLAAAEPLTAQDQLQKVWQRASEIGRYQFRTTGIQTKTPVVILENAGRSAKTERMVVERTVDKSTESGQCLSDVLFLVACMTELTQTIDKVLSANRTTFNERNHKMGEADMRSPNIQ